MRVDQLRKAYEREISLLEDLCQCLSEERECLINARMEGLWPLKERKEEICNELKTQEEVIRACYGDEQYEDKARWEKGIQELRKKVSQLKFEISSRNTENMKIVQDMLDFIDGLIAAFTNVPGEGGAYGKINGAKTHSHPRILYREV